MTITPFRKTALFGCLLFLKTFAFGQAQLGLRLDNFAGVNALALNPSAGATAAFGWDINLAGVGASLGNNLLFVGSASVGGVLAHTGLIGAANSVQFQTNTQNLYFYDFFNQPHEKFFVSSVFAALPSAQFNFENGTSFGFSLAERAAFGSFDIPLIADAYFQQKILRGEKRFVPPLRVMGASWGEFGLNFSKKILDDTKGSLTVGATVKILTAQQGVFLENFDGTAVTRLSKDSTILHALNTTVGFTDNFQHNLFGNNGGGWSFDIGATWTLGGNADYESKPYDWRFGVALLDVGVLNFSKNAQVHDLKFNEPKLFITKDYNRLDLDNPEVDFINRFNEKILNNPNGSLRGTAFSMRLPMTLSLQADYAATDAVFINATLIQRLPTGYFTLPRANLLAVTPRYETRWLGASLPLSMVEWRQIHVGLAVRLAYLTFGSDNLLSFLGEEKLSGTDFYIALKINPSQVGKLRIGSVGGGSGGKTGNCYRF